jgi:hypothetical protein
MWFALGNIIAANTHIEIAFESEVPDLLCDSPAAPARYNSELKIPVQPSNRQPYIRQQRRILSLVGAHPQPVGHRPLPPRDSRSAIHAVPVRRVMPREVALAPGNPERGKHARVSGAISGKGVEQRAVPVKENQVDRTAGAIPMHSQESYQDRSRKAPLGAKTQRYDVVPLQREIIKRRGVSPPARIFGRLGTNDMCCGVHLHATLTNRAIDESNLKVHGHPYIQTPRGQKIDSARTDVARHQRNGETFAHAAYADQPKRQRELRARVPAVFSGNTDGVSWHAGETPWSRLCRKRADRCCVSFDCRQR